MAVTCPVQGSLTDNELNSTFGDATVTGILPSTPNSSSDRDANGMLNTKALALIVSSLKSSGVIPVGSTKDTDAYVAKKAVFLKNIQAEYCFYDSRYKYTLEQLFAAIRSGYNANTTDNSGTIQKYLTLSQTLNKRLNDLTQIINSVVDDMLKVTSEMETEIAAFVKKIKEQQVKLDEQNKIISSGEATIKIKKEMVKYTEEKARNSTNLLNLYSFLNVVALGLLVYVYKAAE